MSNRLEELTGSSERYLVLGVLHLSILFYRLRLRIVVSIVVVPVTTGANMLHFSPFLGPGLPGQLCPHLVVHFIENSPFVLQLSPIINNLAQSRLRSACQGRYFIAKLLGALHCRYLNSRLLIFTTFRPSCLELLNMVRPETEAVICDANTVSQ